MLVFLFLYWTLLASAVASQNVTSKGDVLTKTKGGRLLSLFSVVTFKNVQCSGSSSTSSNQVMGTCMSATECSGKANSNADGNCASGFGVCCVFTVSGCTTTISENCTYVQNTGYPSAYSTTSGTCTTTISRPTDCVLCQIRLDFERFVTRVATGGVCSGAGDALVATAPFSSSALAFPPTVCGTLTGQHMYFETGTTGNPTFTISTGTDSLDRYWRIKVTFIECGHVLRAPDGCHQYLTGSSGIVESFGYSGQQIQGMRSNYCLRQEAGYCTIQYFVNPAETDGFAVSSETTSSETTTCATAYLSIDTLFVCGGVFSSADAAEIDAAYVDTTVPFFIRHRSITGTALTDLTGFSLAYTQIPC